MGYNPFKEGREEVNDFARPDGPSTSTTFENIEAVKKLILDNHQSLLERLALAYRSAYVKQFLRMLYVWRVRGVDLSKIAKF